MPRKEFTKHYNNILNCPSIGKYLEKEDYLKDEIQRLADIDKIPYRVALDRIYNVFLWTDPNDSNFRELEIAMNNLVFLRCLEGKEHKDE